MLTVKTSVGPSDIQGMGLFTQENIPAGATVWVYDPRFDISFDCQEVEMMLELQRELITRFAYISKETGKYIFCIDNSRFINHLSSGRNNLDVVRIMGEPEWRGIANRDIEVGEEITVDYQKLWVTQGLEKPKSDKISN